MKQYDNCFCFADNIIRRGIIVNRDGDFYTVSYESDYNERQLVSTYKVFRSFKKAVESLREPAKRLVALVDNNKPIHFDNLEHAKNYKGLEPIKVLTNKEIIKHFHY